MNNLHNLQFHGNCAQGAWFQLTGNTEAQKKSNVPVIVGATVPTVLLAAAATGACIWYLMAAKRKKYA